jgi:hypothetical protein
MPGSANSPRKDDRSHNRIEQIVMREYQLGRLAGLNLSVVPLALAGSILLLVLLCSIGIGVLNLPIGEAILGSLLAVLLHWISVTAHHLGHAWAARRTGYAMMGIRFGMWGLLASSVYPRNEQALPAKIHIQRALGGPLGSFLVSIFALAVAFVLRAVNDTLGWVGIFFFLDNLLVFTLGVFVPLGFTDGSTLLQWWRKR